MRVPAFRSLHGGIRAMAIGLLALGVMTPGSPTSAASPYLPEEPMHLYPQEMTLDLPAMVLLPEEYPVPGLESVGGRLNGPERESFEWREDDSLVDGLTEIGWRARYTGQAVTLRDDTPNLYSISAQSYVTEFADDEGAARGFDLLENDAEGPGGDIEGVRQVGDEAELTRILGVDDTLGQSLTLDYTFRSGNLIGGVMITWYVNLPDELVTPAEMADTAEILLARMSRVREAGPAELPAKILRVEATAATAGNQATDDYFFLDGNVFVGYSGSAGSVAEIRANWEEQGINTIYVTWREFWSTDEPDGTLTSVIPYLYRFDTSRDARRFARVAGQDYLERHSKTHTGEVLAGDALPEARGAVSGVSYTTTWRAGEPVTGVRYWVQVGTDVVVLQVESSGDVDPAAIQQLLDAQLACLDAEGFCAPVSAPKGLVD